MQKLYRASLTFKLQKTAKKPVFGSNVINALSALLAKDKFTNPNFFNLPVPLKELQAINGNLSAALATAISGKQLDVKVAVLQWDAAFTLTANYITSFAKGDEIFIANTGFIPVKNENITQPKVAASKYKTAVNNYTYSVS